MMSIYGPFPMEFLKLLSRLSGKKVWYGTKRVDAQTSGSNLLIVKESGFEIDWKDLTGVLRQMTELEMMKTQHSSAPQIDVPYNPRVPFLKHMDHCIRLSWDRKAYAYFLEMGLCKTSITVHNFGILFKKGEITGVLILAPLGVHAQWILEQIPEHLDPSIKVNMTLWDKKEDYTRRDFFVPGVLNIFAINIDSIRTIAGQEACALFIRLHECNIFMVVDESHRIKNYTAVTTRECVTIGNQVKYKRILTGTPVAKSLADLWSQIMFLNPEIIGIDTLTVFKMRFCQMGGFENREIKGSRNIEEFYRLIAPHCYRLTKAEATDLPPKLYSKHMYEMDDATEEHYDNMKHSYMMELENQTFDAKNWLSCVIKLQQLLSGFITVDPKTREYKVISHQRADIVCEMLSQINGQVIVWCVFIPDIIILRERIKKKLKEDCATLDDIDSYKKKRKRIALLNPASGGTGLNLQFPTDGDNNAVYYNNTERSLPRWQSEDRIYRMGMGGRACIWDIVCRKSIDAGNLRRLKEKKDLSDLVLDDIRQMIAGD